MYVKFEKNIAMIKVNQSVNKDILTVTFLIYEATKETIKKHKELVPSGSPLIVSLIIPARNICPFPIIPGLLSIQ